ncbi:nucleotidyl transferase AbiEii/AbiGii toxin family protein [Candidatus Aerophobetes bacterium]|nr:nucleotidyl transferase AbiEii/AbiGii toxin family protein [Candidatus Aerophobetes bacterium]
MITAEKIKQKTEIQGVSARLVFKEYVHLVILEYLFRKGFFSHLVFQGGTALRFVYKGVRYSEDLDFVLRKKDAHFFSQLIKSLQPLSSYIDRLIPLVKNPQLEVQKNTSNFTRFSLTLEVEFLRAKDKTLIEIAHVPSYSAQTMILKVEDIPLSPGIAVERPQEILSDKFLAFASRNYLKGRDLWDIYFILNTLQVPVNEDVKRMLEQKISDYRLTKEKFMLKFQENLILLKKNGTAIIREEMDKFLPLAYRNLFKDKYPDICKEELNILSKLFKEFKKR